MDGVKPAVSVDLIALQPAATLLAPHDARLERLRQQASCSAVQFAAVYAPLLERFAEYVQRVPCATQPECTILESRLAAAERILARRRGAILPRNAGPEHVAREADLWTYVLFSAALLRCLAAEFAPWAITVWSSQRRPLGRWRPPVAPRGLAHMPRAAAYDAQPSDDAPGVDWTLLAVGALLPSAASNWLWREPHMHAVWRQLFLGDPPAELIPLLTP